MQSAASWLEAWRGWRDNPLPALWAQTLTREGQDKPWWKRDGMLWLAAVCASAASTLLIVLALQDVAVLSQSALCTRYEALAYFRAGTVSLLLGVLIVAGTYLLSRTFHLAYLALSLLSRGGQRERWRLDGELALSRLSDQDIVVGLIVYTLRSLVWPLAVVCLSGALFCITALAWEFHILKVPGGGMVDPWIKEIFGSKAPQLGTYLVYAGWPTTLKYIGAALCLGAAQYASGLAGGCGLVLLMLALGRGALYRFERALAAYAAVAAQAVFVLAGAAATGYVRWSLRLVLEKPQALAVTLIGLALTALCVLGAVKWPAAFRRAMLGMPAYALAAFGGMFWLAWKFPPGWYWTMTTASRAAILSCLPLRIFAPLAAEHGLLALSLPLFDLHQPFFASSIIGSERERLIALAYHSSSAVAAEVFLQLLILCFLGWCATAALRRWRCGEGA